MYAEPISKTIQSLQTNAIAKASCLYRAYRVVLFQECTFGCRLPFSHRDKRTCFEDISDSDSKFRVAKYVHRVFLVDSGFEHHFYWISKLVIDRAECVLSVNVFFKLNMTESGNLTNALITCSESFGPSNSCY